MYIVELLVNIPVYLKGRVGYERVSLTLIKESMRKLRAFELWIYKRFLKISWVDRIGNTEVFRRIGEETETVATIKTIELAYVSHIICRDRYMTYCN